MLWAEICSVSRKENVTSATASLLKKYERIYEKERAVYRVHFVLSVKSDKKISLTASANDLKRYCFIRKLAAKSRKQTFYQRRGSFET